MRNFAQKSSLIDYFVRNIPFLALSVLNCPLPPFCVLTGETLPYLWGGP
jgi:hypothetical protein